MKDDDCIRSDINVLEKMVGQYEKKGGGYSQKEALKTAISFLKDYLNCKGWPKEEEKCPKTECIPYEFCGCRVNTINKTIGKCRLASLKAVPSVEDVDKAIDSQMYSFPQRSYNNSQIKAYQKGLDMAWKAVKRLFQSRPFTA